MICACGNPLTALDDLESECVRIHKTMCASCRADYLEFHEAEVETNELLTQGRLILLEKSVARSVGKYL